MDTSSPPRKKGERSGPVKTRPPQSDKNQPSIADPWVQARLNFWSAECARLEAGEIAQFSLRKAKQHARRRDPRLRSRVWNCLDVVADRLIGRENMLRRASNSHREENPL
jgi:hypothetical protein